MKENKEYVATFKHSKQMTEDSFVLTNPSLKVTNETTIGDIDEWMKGYFSAVNIEFTVIALDHIK